MKKQCCVEVIVLWSTKVLFVDFCPACLKLFENSPSKIFIVSRFRNIKIFFSLIFHLMMLVKNKV